MRIAVTGATGFIGKHFVDSFRGRDEQLVVLDRHAVPLGDSRALEKALKGVDALVHLAFDHSYQDNIPGVKNLLAACRSNQVPTFVHISSFVTRDFLSGGEIREDSPDSPLRDPYTSEKRRVERIVEHFADPHLRTVILMPTIVYGLGGSWSQFAFSACKHAYLKIPYGGESLCPAVYVKDVVSAIWSAIASERAQGRFLVSGPPGGDMTWADFVEGHEFLLSKWGQETKLKIVASENPRNLHSKFFLRVLLRTWFLTPFGVFFNGLLKAFLGLRGRKSQRPARPLQVAFEPLVDRSSTPSGLAKLTIGASTRVSGERARRELGFVPQWPWPKGTEDMAESFEVQG